MVLGNPPTIWKIRQRFHYRQSLIHLRTVPWVLAMCQTLFTDCPWATYILWIQLRSSDWRQISWILAHYQEEVSPAPREFPLIPCTSQTELPAPSHLCYWESSCALHIFITSSEKSPWHFSSYLTDSVLTSSEPSELLAYVYHIIRLTLHQNYLCHIEL